MKVLLNMQDWKMATDAIAATPKIDSFQVIRKSVIDHVVVTKMNYAVVLGA